MSATNPIPNSLEALLVDEAWLKRLAAGLVGESGAEDLAQDVLVAAIKTPPREGGAQLRAWAKTVARRLATRRGGRDRGRQLAEQGAARPESFDQDSEQRLRLHQRLTEAILSQDAQHRTILVMRYLEERTPAEIADSLNITQATARKRLSRAMAKLREALDGEFGERGQWMQALAPMAFGAGWQDMLPELKATTALTPASVGALTPILALLTMKKLILGSIALCVALLVGMPALQDWLRGSEGNPSAESLVHEQTIIAPVEVELVANDTTETRGSVAPVALASAVATTPQIVLVDSQGQPITGGVGAWLDKDMQVTPLEFNDSGRANLPEAALGSLCLVRAPGLAIADFLVESIQESLTVKLGPLTRLRGRLIVEDGPPSATVEIGCTWYFIPLTPFAREATRMDPDSGDILQQLGLMSGEMSTRTLPGGEFAFEGFQPGSNGHIKLPKYLKVLPDETSSWAAFQRNENDLLIETTSLPYVYGRLVWADEGTPYQGSLNVGFTNRMNEEFEWSSVQLSPSGAFSVPLNYLNDTKEDGLKHVSVQFETSGNGVRKGQTFTCNLEGDRSPWDMGVLRVERQNVTRVRVVDRSGAPVSHAFVRGASSRARTGDDGQVSLAVTPGDFLVALANGHGLGVLDTSLESADSDGLYVIQLPAGNDLTITSKLQGPSSAGKPTAIVQVDLPNELLGRAAFRGPSALGIYSDSFDGHLGMAMYRWGMMVSFPGLAEAIVLPGIAAGTLVKARLVDVKGNVLARDEIRILKGAQASNLELVPDPRTYGALHFEVTNDQGQPLRGVLAQGVSGNWQMGHFRSEDHRVVVTPLATGHYRFRVGALGRAWKNVDVELRPGIHKEQVVLGRGRDVDVRFEDRDGATLNPEAVTLLDMAGEPMGETQKPKAGMLHLDRIPWDSLQLLIRVGTRTSMHAVPADGKTLTVVLETPGILRVHFDQIPGISAGQGELSLVVNEGPVADGKRLERMDTFNRGANGTWDQYAALHPGAYQVQVHVITDVMAVDRAAVTRILFEGQVTIVAGAGALITISAGENPTVTLTPPS